MFYSDTLDFVVFVFVFFSGNFQTSHIVTILWGEDSFGNLRSFSALSSGGEAAGIPSYNR